MTNSLSALGSKPSCLLKGKENYIQWKKRLMLKAIAKKWVTITQDENGAQMITYAETKKSEFLEWLSENVADEALYPVDYSKSILENMKRLNLAYGRGREDPAILKAKIKVEIHFDVRKDPQAVFAWLENRLDELSECAGTMVTDETKKEIILQGLNCTVEAGRYGERDFWFNCRGHINTEMANKTSDEVATYICKFWHGYRTSQVDVEEGPFIPAIRNERAMQVSEANKVQETRKFKKFECKHCINVKERKRIANTHPTEKCRFVKDKSESNEVQQDNKTDDQAYSASYFDTGCTPHSYFKDKPENCVPIEGFVHTAGKGNKPNQVKGVGTVQIGDIKLDSVKHVPTFNRNLVSGIQLMKKGYRSTMYNNALVIDDLNKPVATGLYDEDSGLIQMTKEISDEAISRVFGHANAAKELTINDWHRKLGHIGNTTLVRTLDHLKIGIRKTEIQKCEPCLLGKAKSTKGKPGSLPAGKLLEVIESDTQGPFSIKGVDGSIGNVKFVETKSGYIWMETLDQLSATRILPSFSTMKEIIERQTGCKVKKVRTDGGSEFKGVFSSYLYAQGIKKEKGLAHRHHYPPRAERAHQTIMALGRAMLIESNLPIEYYVEAQQTAVYVWFMLERKNVH